MYGSSRPVIWGPGVVLLAALVPLAAGADDRSSLRPEALSLPAGPGTIQGLGEALEVNPSQGTASYRVPIEVPAGAGGHRPNLALVYESGGPAGEVGVGWSLGLPVIRRSVKYGLPALASGLPGYEDGDRLSMSGSAGAGDLVAMPDGSFRLDPEEGFLRARPAREAEGLESGVAVESPDGMLYVFGVDDTARVVGPYGTYAWHLSFVRDPHGNVIRYEYRNTANFPVLQAIRWNLEAGELEASVLFEWETRPDAVVSWVSGEESALDMRVRRIEVRRGTHVHRTIDLDYADDTGLSRLQRVQLTGWDGTPAPPLTLAYAEPSANPPAVPIADPPGVGLTSETAELVDWNGDALPDLVEMDPDRFGGAYRVFTNLGDRFGAPEVLADSPSVWLGTMGGSGGGTAWLTQLADVDGDARADILTAADGSGGTSYLRYLPVLEGGAIGDSVALGGAGLSISPFDPDVRFSDVDLDRLPDLLRIAAGTGDVRIALGRDGWSSDRSIGTAPDPSLDFTNPSVRLLDLNADGLDDLAILAEGRLTFYAGLGFGYFDGVPRRIEPFPDLTAAELAAAQLRDLTGDGLPDLVHLGIAEIRIWPLEGTARFSTAPFVVTSLPARNPLTTEVRLADVNGNGTTDLLWVDVVEPSVSGPWVYVDLLSEGGPALLRRVDNGLGGVTELTYAGMGAMVQRAGAEGLASAAGAVVPMSVVAERRISDGIDLDSRQAYVYGGGRYDRGRREFVGFGEVLTVREATGSGSHDGQESIGEMRTVERYDLGDTDRALAGRLVRRRQIDSGGVVYREDRESHAVIPLGETAIDGTVLRRGVTVDRQTIRREASRDDPVAATRTRIEHDALGFPTRTTILGLVDPENPDDAGAGDDETVRETDFAHDAARWRFGLPSATRVLAADGTLVEAHRTYYDGQPLGEVGSRGLPTSESSWVVGETWATTTYEYDDRGNRVVILGAEGQRTGLRFDASGTFPVEAVRTTGNAAVPELHWLAVFDPAQGDKLVRLTDPDDTVTDVRYDGLGRPVALFLPGDGADDPTIRYDYHAGAPISHVTVSRILDSDSVATSRTFRSGAGVALGVVERVRAGSWRVTGRIERNGLGWVVKAFEPYAVDLPEPGDAMPEVPSDIAASQAWYDAEGRVVRERDARGADTVTAYGARSTTVLDPLDVERGVGGSFPVTRVLDGQGRLVEVREARSGAAPLVYHHRYDAAGRPIEVADAHGTAIRVAWDGRGLKREVSHPDFGAVSFEYDLAGREVRRVDGDGALTTTAYDLLDRRVRMDAVGADGTAEAPIVFAYDVAEDGLDPSFASGRLGYADSEGGRLALQYDARGRVVVEHRTLPEGQDYRFASEYDRGGRRTARGFPDGRRLVFAYDEVDQVTEVPDVVRRIDFDARGKLTRVEFPDGSVLSHAYDAAGNQVGIRLERDDRTLLDVTRALDSNGNPIGVEDLVDGPLGRQVTAEYDELDRLVGFTDEAGRTTFSFDERNRLLEIASPHEGFSLVNRFPAAPSGMGPANMPIGQSGQALVWSPGGRLLGDPVREYEWSAWGRVRRIREGGSAVLETWRDHDGAVVTRKAAGRSTLFPAPDYRQVDGEAAVVVSVPGAFEVIMGGTRVADSGSGPGGTVAGGVARAVCVLSILLLAAWCIRVGSGRRGSEWAGRRAWTPVAVGIATSCALAAAGWGHGCAPGAPEPRPDQVTIEDWQGTPIGVLDADGLHRIGVLPYGGIAVGDDESGGGAFYHADFVHGTRLTADGLIGLAQREFDTRRSLFLSADPLLVDEPGSSADMPRMREPFAYGFGNPLRYSDPEGLGLLEPESRAALWQSIQGVANMMEGYGSAVEMQEEGGLSLHALAEASKSFGEGVLQVADVAARGYAAAAAEIKNAIDPADYPRLHTVVDIGSEFASDLSQGLSSGLREMSGWDVTKIEADLAAGASAIVGASERAQEAVRESVTAFRDAEDAVEELTSVEDTVDDLMSPEVTDYLPPAVDMIESFLGLGREE